MPDEPGISHRVFSAIAEQNIVVDMIAQSVGRQGKGPAFAGEQGLLLVVPIPQLIEVGRGQGQPSGNVARTAADTTTAKAGA